MLPDDEHFKNLSESELWQRYCGFLDLSVDEFMGIQKELLTDQIERVANSTLGKKIMGGSKPQSVEEFRRLVPLTTYDDYEPYLSERREDALAFKPQYWCRSAGRGGLPKWIPYSLEAFEKYHRNGLASFIIASATKKGQVNIKPGLRLLGVLPPPPYPSGTWFQFMQQRLSYKIFPPLEEGDTDFQERMQKGLMMALKEGADIAVSLGSILVKIGEGFTGETKRMKFSTSMLHPGIISRLLRARFRSKREKRGILPKDLWPLKGIVIGGVDTDIYRDAIFYYWGVKPHEFYVSTELGVAATQGLKGEAMTFTPDIAFLEFIPAEKLNSAENMDRHPATFLLDELEEGKLYEVVISHFYGMPLLRYRTKDVFKIVALKDEEAGGSLPQVVFQHRVGDTINLAGLVELDEKTIWRAITNTGIKYNEWAACKIYEQNKSFLGIYIELKEERETAEIENLIDEQLKLVDSDYGDVEYYLKAQPVRVTPLSPGTFQGYMEKKVKEGADMAHLKPPHMNPPESDIQYLLKLSEAAKKV